MSKKKTIVLRILALIIFTLGWSMLYTANSFGQKIDRTPNLKVHLDTNIILIGDQIHFTLSASIPENMEVIFPNFNDTIIGPIEIIEKHTPDTSQKTDGFLQITHDYIITSFDTGLHIIPPMDFNFKQHNFDNIISTDSLGLYVTTFKIDTTKGFYDIKPPLTAPLSWGEIKPYLFIFLMGILVLILVVLIIVYIITKRRNIPFFGRIKPKLPPHQTAFNELEKIKKKKLYQRGKIKQYYTEVTDTLRIYLEDRFNMKTMEKTSDEILADAKKTDDIKKPHILLLSKMLKSADLVKFAKEKPFPDESDRFWKNAFKLIDETKYIEEENEKNV